MGRAGVPAQRRQTRGGHHRGARILLGRLGRHAAIDHVNDWVTGSSDWVSMGIPSNSAYGIPEGLDCGFPCTCTDGR